MKATFKILITLSMLFLGNVVIAQTFKATDASINISGLSTVTSQENFLLNQGNVTNKNLTSKSNSVYLSQIGNDNNLSSTTKTLESNIVVLQNGNQNNTVLKLSSDNLMETVFQNGNNNTFLDYSLLKTDIRNVEVNQTGDNQNLTMYGSNSLSEKMKVSMNGNGQSIIIRNF
jgi:hypothetical protein